MNELSKFCTCSDTACPFHPANHDRGCEPCIAKNLKEGEIPTCFFKSVDSGYKGPGYKKEDFAKLVTEKNRP